MEILGINLTTGNLWLLGIAGACVVLLVPYWRDRHNRKVAAAAAFRTAFAQCLAALESKNDLPASLHTFLQDARPQHDAAIIALLPHLSFFQKRSLRKAWQQYHSGHSFQHEDFGIKNAESYFLEYVSMYYAEGQGEEAARKLATERLQNILRYAKAT